MYYIMRKSYYVLHKLLRHAKTNLRYAAIITLCAVITLCGVTHLCALLSRIVQWSLAPGVLSNVLPPER